MTEKTLPSDFHPLHFHNGVGVLEIPTGELVGLGNRHGIRNARQFLEKRWV